MEKGKRFVDVETPYNGKNEEEIKTNILYARACVRDCIMRKEIPYASHLFFTQPGILDDTVAEERLRGIELGKAIIAYLPDVKTIVYLDLGISVGMQYGIDLATHQQRKIEYRHLGAGWMERELVLARRHAHASLWGVNF